MKNKHLQIYREIPKDLVYKSKMEIPQCKWCEWFGKETIIGTERISRGMYNTYYVHE